MGNVSESSDIRDGYDLPVYGLDNGLFYALHIPAIVCIIASFTCAVVAIIFSFRRHHRKSFFSWTRCDRFIVYLAICDGCFNIAHGSDHLHVTITKSHVYPRSMCQIYGFITAVFMTSQSILVGLIAVNTFVMMYFQKKLKFGRFDWFLLTLVYGIPAAGGIVAWCLGYLGPNGLICLTDGVKGRTVFILFFTIPLLLILAMNTTLYTLTWLKIRHEIRLIRNSMGQEAPNRKTARRVAKSMTMFVAAFFIQWWAAGLYGAWGLCGEIPALVSHTATTFSNIGGVLNLGVFFLINRKRLTCDKRKTMRSSFVYDSKVQDSGTDHGLKIESAQCSVSTIS